MPEPTPFFRHSPLDLSKQSIRVFRIRACEADGPIAIACELFHIPEPAGHVAVSYVWGSPLPCHSIYVNGQHYRVARNLYILLKRLVVLNDTSAYYWVDAICIDQDNVVEKNHQVQQMGDVYKAADQVLCWLGDSFTTGVGDVCHALRIGGQRDASNSPTESQKAIHIVLAKFHDQVNGDRHLYLEHSPPRPSDEITSIIRSENASPADNYATYFWRSLKILCQVEYWNRGWIIQEFLLNDKCRLLYGNRSVPARKLSNFIFACSSCEIISICQSPWSSETVQAWPAGRLVLKFGNELIRSGSADLDDLLRSTEGVQCSDPRDLIYSLLSLCRLRLTVDYSHIARDLIVDVWEACGTMTPTELVLLRRTLRVSNVGKLVSFFDPRRSWTRPLNGQRSSLRMDLPQILRVDDPKGRSFGFRSDRGGRPVQWWEYSDSAFAIQIYGCTRFCCEFGYRYTELDVISICASGSLALVKVRWVRSATLSYGLAHWDRTSCLHEFHILPTVEGLDLTYNSDGTATMSLDVAAAREVSRWWLMYQALHERIL